MKLVKPEKPLPPNQIKFIIPLQMTKYDVKNYLEKIYNVPVADVNTVVQLGNIKKAEGKTYLIKEDDFRVAYVTLPKGQEFVFPDLFPEDVVQEKLTSYQKQMEEADKVKKQHIREDPNRQDLPSWFAI